MKENIKNCIEENVLKNMEVAFAPYAWLEMPPEHIIRNTIKMYSDQLNLIESIGEDEYEKLSNCSGNRID